MLVRLSFLNKKKIKERIGTRNRGRAPPSHGRNSGDCVRVPGALRGGWRKKKMEAAYIWQIATKWSRLPWYLVLQFLLTSAYFLSWCLCAFLVSQQGKFKNTTKSQKKILQKSKKVGPRAACIYHICAQCMSLFFLGGFNRVFRCFFGAPVLEKPKNAIKHLQKQKAGKSR